MQENKRHTQNDFIDEDIPDLSTPEWEKKIAKAVVKRGRPVSGNPKISTTIRLDAEVINGLKATGKGWQTLANALLRKGLDL